MNSIPGFSISGEGEINMDESNREFYESITCKVDPMLELHRYKLISSDQMYGDFILESAPSTFNESIRAYKVTCVTTFVMQEYSLGTALASWNEGRPVHGFLSCGVSPGPNFRGLLVDLTSMF